MFEDDVRRVRLADDANRARLKRVLANGESQLQDVRVVLASCSVGSVSSVGGSVAVGRAHVRGPLHLPRLIQHPQRLDVPGLDLVRHAGADDGERSVAAADAARAPRGALCVDAREGDERAVVPQKHPLLHPRADRRAPEPDSRRARLRVHERGRVDGDVRQRALAAQLEAHRVRAVANRSLQRRRVRADGARRESHRDEGVLARLYDERLGPGEQRHGEGSILLVAERRQRDVHDARDAFRVEDSEVGSHRARGERRRSFRRFRRRLLVAGAGGRFAVALRIRRFLRARRLRLRLHLRRHRAEAERAVPPGVDRGDGAARAGGGECFPIRQVRVQLAVDHLVLFEDARERGVAGGDAWDDALAAELVRHAQRLVARVAIRDVQAEKLGERAVVRGGELALERELLPRLDRPADGAHDERADRQSVALRLGRGRGRAEGFAVAVAVTPAVVERVHLERERAVVRHVERARAHGRGVRAGQVRAEIHPAARRERVLGERRVHRGVHDDAARRARRRASPLFLLGILQQTRRVALLLRARLRGGHRGLGLLLHGLGLRDGQHHVRRVHQLQAPRVRVGGSRDVENHRALRRRAGLDLA